MKYSEQEAERIRQEYGIKDSTIRQWRYRKAIPNRYSTGENKRIPVSCFSVGEKTMLQLIADAIHNQYLSFEKVCMSIGVPHRPYYDAIKGKGVISVNEMTAVCARIKEVIKELNGLIPIDTPLCEQ